VLSRRWGFRDRSVALLPFFVFLRICLSRFSQSFLSKMADIDDLNSYKIQLQQVVAALVGEPNSEELLKLKGIWKR